MFWYLQHLLQHCEHVTQKDGMYHCAYLRCSGRFHSSSGELKTHVELSHLSRIALPCPTRSCNEVFIRVQQLSNHFEHAHRELLDTCASVDAFAPLAVLAQPHHLPVPPPLSYHESRTAILFLPLVSMPPIRRGHSQASTSQSILRRWSRLNVQDEEHDEHPIPFDNLPSLGSQDIITPQLVDIEVRRKLPRVWQPLLSGPQRVIHPPISSNEPEQTILYCTFKPMVDKLVAVGALANHKEWGM